MHDIVLFLRYQWDWIVVGLGTVSLIVAAISLWTLQRNGKQPMSPTDDLVRARLDQATAMLRNHERSRKRYRLASNVLVFAECVIGAAIASAYVSTLDAKITSVLGLVVLLSTTIQQRYRPYAKVVDAEHTIVDLQETILQAENDIATKKPPEEILNRLTKGIMRVQRRLAHHADLTPGQITTPAPAVQNAPESRAATNSEQL